MDWIGARWLWVSAQLVVEASAATTPRVTDNQPDLLFGVEALVSPLADPHERAHRATSQITGSQNSRTQRTDHKRTAWMTFTAPTPERWPTGRPDEQARG